MVFFQNTWCKMRLMPKRLWDKIFEKQVGLRIRLWSGVYEG
jgi:hypothetical protein